MGWREEEEMILTASSQGGNQHRGVRGISILHVQGASNNARVFGNLLHDVAKDFSLKTQVFCVLIKLNIHICLQKASTICNLPKGHDTPHSLSSPL